MRAIDLGNGVEDDNLVEQSVTAVGPSSGLNVVLFEDFEAPGSFFFGP